MGWLIQWHWIAHALGIEPRTPSTAYNFWSGFGSDIGEMAVVGGVYAALRHANCHSKGCWRMRTHPVQGTPYKACAKHHPVVPSRVTEQVIADAHAKANEG